MLPLSQLYSAPPHTETTAGLHGAPPHPHTPAGSAGHQDLPEDTALTPRPRRTAADNIMAAVRLVARVRAVVEDRAMTTSTPQPDINSLYERLKEARNRTWAEANDAHMRTLRIAEETSSDPSARELIGLAAIEAIIELTAQVHHLTVATRTHTDALERDVPPQ